MKRAFDWLRQHPEGIVFLVGTLLFTGGLAAVIKRQLSPDPAPSAGPGATQPGASAARVGPAPDEALKPYIDRRKSVLAARASKEPRKSSFAVVSFDSYRKPSDVSDFLARETVAVWSLEMRVPVARFKSEKILVRGRPLGEASADFTGPARLQALTREMAGLQAAAAGTVDPAFKQVYQQGADGRRKAIEILKAGGGTVFAVVIEASHSTLARIASRTGVRLVDLPEDPAATPADHEFAGILPEDTAVARFAVE